MKNALTRGIALFLAAFTVVNLVGDLQFARANANVWWIDFWPLPLMVSRIVLLLLAVALVLHAVAPRLANRHRTASIGLLCLAAFAAVVNVIRFYMELARGGIRAAWPVPLSLLVVIALVAIILDYGDGSARLAGITATAVVAAVLFPVAQVCFFGVTDYRRPADLVVVFGARANADGTASDALADRVATACDLYRAGFARRLLFSGGPGVGAFSEPRVMADLAKRLGVPAAAILEDPNGVNTEATVRNTCALAGPSPRILAVSHFYHLPRIKMTYQRYGVDVSTVPSRDTVPFSMPYNIAREDLAFWAYYLRRLA